jgi:uncharacterized protein (DUF4415 family)
MIPIPPFLAAIPADRIAKIVFGLGFALCFFLIGMGVHKTFSDRKIARMEKEQAEARAELNAQIAEAEQHARKVEAEWIKDVRRVEEKYMAAIRQRDAVVRNLSVAGDGLQQRLTDLQQQAAAGSTSSCRDVHKRVETLVLLLREVDDLAEESGRAADDLGSELALCRAYAETVSKQD